MRSNRAFGRPDESRERATWICERRQAWEEVDGDLGRRRCWVRRWRSPAKVGTIRRGLGLRDGEITRAGTSSAAKSDGGRGGEGDASSIGGKDKVVDVGGERKSPQIYAAKAKAGAVVDEALTRHPTSSVALAARAGDGRRRRRRRRCDVGGLELSPARISDDKDELAANRGWPSARAGKKRGGDGDRRRRRLRRAEARTKMMTTASEIVGDDAVGHR